jgi:hypothetical protein
MSTSRGRPRLTPELYQERRAAYCAKYHVAPLDTGLPPFPTGQRETAQHGEWISLYKAWNRIGRRDRGQCERCAAPVSPGSIFCDAHRAHSAGRAGGHGSSVEDRRALLEAQDGRCPICADTVALWDSVDHSHVSGQVRALLHQRCNQLAGLAEALGPEALDRARAYLWPAKRKRSR